MDKFSNIFSIISTIIVIIGSVATGVIYLDSRLHEQDVNMSKINNEIDKVKRTFDCFIKAVDEGVNPRICTTTGNEGTFM